MLQLNVCVASIFYHKLNFQELDEFQIKPNADENENGNKSEGYSRKVQVSFFFFVGGPSKCFMKIEHGPTLVKGYPEILVNKFL